MYTVTLRVGGETSTQELEARKDPDSEGTLADIAQQFAMQKWLHADTASAAALINRLESVRRQVLDARDLLTEQGGNDSIVETASALDARLMESLGYLLNTVSVADFRPTAQAGEVQVILQERLARISEALQAVLNDDLEEFNRLIQSLGLRIVS
jgi:hypothetical protein